MAAGTDEIVCCICYDELTEWQSTQAFRDGHCAGLICDKCFKSKEFNLRGCPYCRVPYTNDQLLFLANSQLTQHPGLVEIIPRLRAHRQDFLKGNDQDRSYMIYRAMHPELDRKQCACSYNFKVDKELLEMATRLLGYS